MVFLKKIKIFKFNKGMTYVELIVVLGIFSLITSVSMFNYGSFQARVDIRNLANDIALKIVQAQKDASYGKFPSSAQYNLLADPTTWKPSYGIYVNKTNNKTFFRFVDLIDTVNKQFQVTEECPSASECVEKVQISKGNYIEDISLIGTGCNTITSLHLTFTRPNLTPNIVTDPVATCSYSGIQMVVKSPKGNTATIIVNVSGRVQIN